MRGKAFPMLLLAALTLAPAAQAQDGSGAPRITGAVQVTADPDPGRAHTSPQIVRNPRTGELVIVEGDVRGTRACAVHISSDDGRSWSPGGSLLQEPYTDCTFYAEYGPYASVAFGSDGVLYVAFVASEVLPRQRNDVPRHVFVARSEDGGRTFRTTTVFRAPDGDPDRGLNKGPMVAVDQTESDRVYVGWRQGVFRDAEEKLKSNVAASSDGGRTFGPPVDLTDDRGGDYPAIAVDGEGVVHAVYWTRTYPPVPFGDPNTPVRPIQYLRSTDHGRTFGGRVEVDPGNQDTERPPILVADPASGSLYVTWNAHADPNNTRAGFEGDFDVFFRASRDGGRTWSDRLVLNDDGDSGANQYLPGLAVAPGGRIDVAWYDERLSPGGPETGFHDVFYTSSDDGGRTFGPNVRITDRSIDRRIGVWGNNVDSNHNLGIASTDDVVYFAWQDSREGDEAFQAEDVYTATLQLRDPAPAPVGESRLLWALIGGGIALAAGGVVLVVATRASSAGRAERVEPSGTARSARGSS